MGSRWGWYKGYFFVVVNNSDADVSIFVWDHHPGAGVPRGRRSLDEDGATLVRDDVSALPGHIRTALTRYDTKALSKHWNLAG